jgi:hypothetical protein
LRSAVLIVIVLALAGCASGLRSHASRLSEIPVTVAEVQRAVACEFAYALQNSSGDGRDIVGSWSAVVELTLIAKDTATIAPGLGQMSGTIGSATISTTGTLPSMALTGNVEDKNVLTYVGGIEKQARSAHCPAQNSPLASSGLELAELLIGTSQVINSGGRIASSASIITVAGIGPHQDAVISAGTVFPVAVQEKIPTVKYERSFTVSRKAGGGLSFKVGDVSLTLTGSSIGRDRSENTIKVTMGASSRTLRSTDQADRDEPVEAGSETISLEDSVFQQREEAIKLLQGLIPNEVIVVTPPAEP